MDPLSTAASAFAVIGAADVVLRASAEFVRFVSDIKDAPTEVENLRIRLQDTTLLVEASKAYLETLRNVTTGSSITLETRDLNKALSLFTSAIRGLKRELESLITIIARHHGASKSYGRIKWLLDSRRVAKAQQSLETSKSTLNNALTLVGRHDAALAAKTSERVIEQSLQSIESTLNSTAASMNQGQQKLSMQQQRLTIGMTRNGRDMKAVRKHLSHASSISCQEHNRTRQQITLAHRAHVKKIDALGSKIDDMHLKLSKQAAVRKMSGREIFFVGEKLESVFAQLLLITDTVREAVLHGVSQQIEGISPDQLYWLQAEYDNLVSSATQELAALSYGSTATSFDNWYDSGFAAHTSKTSLRKRAYSQESNRDVVMASSANLDAADQETPWKRTKKAFKSFLYKGAFGELRLICPTMRDRLDNTDRSQEVSLVFTPTAKFSRISISARFVKEVNRRWEPTFYTQLNAFTVVDNGEIHVELMRSGTVQEVDAAFRNGHISPYHLYEDTQTLVCLQAAAIFQRTDLLRYFDSQGIGMADLNAISGFWFTLRKLPGEIEMSEYQAMQEYFEESLPKVNFSGGLLNPPPFFPSQDYRTRWSDGVDQMVEKFFKVLKENNFDFESKGDSGWTSFLTFAFWPGGVPTRILRMLCEYNVNVHVTDRYGWNALHLAMISEQMDSESDHESREPYLEERLAFLIGAGVDLHQRTDTGKTPSVLAQDNDCWDEWCAALERNGLDLDEVLKDEADLWILSDEEDETEDNELNTEPGAEYLRILFPGNEEILRHDDDDATPAIEESHLKT